MKVVRLLSPSLLILLFFACKKNNNTTTTSTSVSNIDSLVGHYYGVTSGDSIYTYTDSTGKPQQWLRSFSYPDTLVVTAPDTATVVVTGKYYSFTFSYGDSLSAYGDSLGLVNNIITTLQTTSATSANESGYPYFVATLTDTTIEYDQMSILVQYGYSKRIISYVTLYSRP